MAAWLRSIGIAVIVGSLAPTVFAAAISGPAKEPWPSAVFSPYVDVAGWPTPRIDLIAKASGVKHFTLAFLVADSDAAKAARWGGYATYPAARESAAEAKWDFGFNLITGINNLRAAGGDVMISFGGENGTPIDSRITDVKELTAEYQRIIDIYRVQAIDFDIEGKWAADAPSIARRSAAIKALQAVNPSLKVWFTLAVLPTGLTNDGLNVLKSALDSGARIDGVNIMAMDYGDDAARKPQGKMGDYAIQAAQSVHEQLKKLFAQKQVKATDDEVWARIGVTPMIGINDLQAEVFDPPAARQLLAFAQEKKLGCLSFWSITRDHGGKGAATSNDSGLPQADYAFAEIFNTFGVGEAKPR